MLALQIQAGALVFVWFALAALNNSGNAPLWAIVGTVIFTVVHLVSVYVLDIIFEASLTGLVAYNGINFLSRMTAILIGYIVCYLALQAWTRRATTAARA